MACTFANGMGSMSSLWSAPLRWDIFYLKQDGWEQWEDGEGGLTTQSAAWSRRRGFLVPHLSRHTRTGACD